MIKRIATLIFSIYGFLVFLFWMFVLIPFFLVVFCLPSPANGNMVFVLSRIWAKAFFAFTLIRYIPVFESKPDRSKEYVFVCNHISYIDIPMMLLASQGFNIRILGKAEMGKIPVFGFIYKMATVSVLRSDRENRGESIREMKSFLNQHISMMICPEGTFNMTREPLKDFYDGAFKIAIECQKPIVPVIFPDTYNRLNYHSIFSMTPGKCRAILLPEISTEEFTIAELPQLKEKVFEIMRKKILELNPNWMS